MMKALEPKDVLFVGLGRSHLAWYRCYLPAIFLGCDWAGFVGDPPDYMMVTSYVRGNVQKPKWSDYRIIILQQPCGRAWANWIQRRQKQGIQVLFDIDDDLRAVASMEHHPRAKIIKKRLPGYELCMKVADGIICSTDFLKKRLDKFNENVWVCENGIDFDRYQLERPAKNDKLPVIGWSGGYGNETVLNSWLPYINDLAKNDLARFISIGVPFADFVYEGINVPFTSIECYPGVLANFDIALAPAMQNNFYKAKSQLRWIEPSAMGIPVIADKKIYTGIEHIKTGISVSSRAEMCTWLTELVGHPEIRNEIGENARQHIKDNFDIIDQCQQWLQVFDSVVSYAQVSQRLSKRASNGTTQAQRAKQESSR